MAPDVFWDLTWHEYNLISSGYELKEQHSTNRTRQIITMLYNVNAKHGKSAEEIWALPRIDDHKLEIIKVDVDHTKDEYLDVLKERLKHNRLKTNN